jgi:phosphoribosyl 1,2-cyclic phosphate phosphodiesterase
MPDAERRGITGAARRHATITVLGSGTSVGIPTLCCGCDVCHSTNPRNRRLRTSAAVRWMDGDCPRCVLIDTGPDFREQALTAKIERVDAVLYTHGHADHIFGLDDLRPLCYTQKQEIPVYGSAETIRIIHRVYDYIFHDEPTQSSRPRIRTHEFAAGPIDVAGVRFTPLKLEHGRGESYGFRFGNAAYLTDHSVVPEEALARLAGLDVLFLDGLRHLPHPTHSTIEQSLAIVERVKPRRAWFTHIAHDIEHERDGAVLPEGVALAYDGLVVDIEL